jgi:hypothetical protein
MVVILKKGKTMKIKCTADINNVPEYVSDGTEKGLMVVRLVDTSLWYYGIFEDFKQATDVAEIIGNGLVLEVNNDNPGEEN